VDVLVRPESVVVMAHDQAGQAGDGVRGRVLSRAFFGHDQLLSVELESGRRLRSRVVGSGAWRPGDEVLVRVVGPVHALPRAER
jgi:hypothetical protein